MNQPSTPPPTAHPIHPPIPPGPTDLPAATAQVEAAHARLSGSVQGWFARRSAGRVELAHELAQQTWSEVWRAVKLGRYDPTRSALGTFVYAVMLNIWRQHAKASLSARGQTASLDPESQACATLDLPDSALTSTLFAERLDLVRRALDEPDRAGLTPDDALLLRLIAQGSTDRELAARLGVAASTAHARKRAALDRLRAHLTPHFHPLPGPSADGPRANQPE
jgi:RNA polymerase sigma factor (sigma-70 family)